MLTIRSVMTPFVATVEARQVVAHAIRLMVEQVMTTPVITVSNDPTTLEALQLLRERAFRQLSVVDAQGQLVSCVRDSPRTSDDGASHFPRVYAENSARTYSANFELGTLVGIVTQTDLVHSLLAYLRQCSLHEALDRLMRLDVRAAEDEEARVLPTIVAGCTGELADRLQDVLRQVHVEAAP